MMRLKRVIGLGLVGLGLGVCALGQAPAERGKTEKPAERAMDSRPIKTYYLKFAGNPNDGNEILTGIRLMVDPLTKMYLVPKQHAIMIRGTEDQFALVEQILREIDRPRKTYRLTYTLSESDSGKKLGVQHFSMVAVSGTETSLKDGSRVPMMNGSATQWTYFDMGLNFDATVTEVEGGVSLQSTVEQSSAVQEHSGSSGENPVVRQAKLAGTSMLVLGKPQVLGALDIPGSTRHLDIEVVVEVVK